MCFDGGPTTRAAIHPLAGIDTVPSYVGELAIGIAGPTTPLTMSSSLSTGAMDETVTFTETSAGAESASLISSPGSLPLTVRKTSGPVVPNVWPALIAASHDATLSGPVTFAYVRSVP